MTVRLEEWRLKRRDTEEWMRHRQLPDDLKKRVRRFVQYKWLATRGVDEESILHSLPADLRRDIQRHLCLDLVRRVWLSDKYLSFRVSSLIFIFCSNSYLLELDLRIVQKGQTTITMVPVTFLVLFVGKSVMCYRNKEYHDFSMKFYSYCKL